MYVPNYRIYMSINSDYELTGNESVDGNGVVCRIVAYECVRRVPNVTAMYTDVKHVFR